MLCRSSTPEQCDDLIFGVLKMKDLMKLTGALQMTSLEIAEMAESRHDVVRDSVKRLVGRGVIHEPAMTEVENKQSLSPNNKTSVYVFSGETGKRDSIVVVAQLSPEFTGRLVDRWLELELQNSQQQAILDQEQQAIALWQHDRAKAASGYRTMMRLMERDLSHLSPEDLIKEKVREAEFLNYLVVGMSSRYFKYWFKTDSVRDELTYVQIEALNELQTFNASLMEAGIDQDERHLMVEAFFNKRYPACKTYRDQVDHVVHYRLDSKQYHLKPTHPRESPLLNPINRLCYN